MRLAASTEILGTGRLQSALGLDLGGHPKPAIGGHKKAANEIRGGSRRPPPFRLVDGALVASQRCRYRDSEGEIVQIVISAVVVAASCRSAYEIQC
jgi:hypothetical protein